MKKSISFVLTAVLAIAMMMVTSCEKTDFVFTSKSDTLITLETLNSPKDTEAMTGSLTTGEGDQIAVTASLDEGTVRIEVYQMPEEQSADELPELSGEPVMTADLSRTDMQAGGVAPGPYMVKAIVLEKATGTVNIEVKPEDTEQWNPAETAEEAGEKAGLGSFSADPSGTSLGEVLDSEFRWMEGVAEGRYGIAAVDVIIHKGDSSIDGGDISFDNNEYGNEWTVDIDGTEVKCFGNREGEATKSIWTKDGFSYAVMAYGAGGDTDYGFKADDLTAVFRTIK